MSENTLYIGKCHFSSNNYCGDALSVSKQGCSLSTTHISMTLLPNEQEQLIRWFCKHNREFIEQILLENGDSNAKL
jgi:ubiquinone biosynthesis protein COQ9